MSNNGHLDFIKESNINELCDLQYLDTCQYHDDEEYIRMGFNTDNLSEHIFDEYPYFAKTWWRTKSLKHTTIWFQGDNSM